VYIDQLVGEGGVQYGIAVPHRTTPSPQGGGEEFAILANRICDAVVLGGPASQSARGIRPAVTHQPAPVVGYGESNAAIGF